MLIARQKVTPEWNYIIRLYRPNEEIRNGTWKFPDLMEVK